MSRFLILLGLVLLAAGLAGLSVMGAAGCWWIDRFRPAAKSAAEGGADKFEWKHVFSFDRSFWYITALNVLTPEYLDDLISADAWAHDLIYTGAVGTYTVGSAGKDGGNSLALTSDGGPTNTFEDDIIYSLNFFLIKMI